MAQVRIYVTDYCPYCHAALALLDKKGVDYESIDVTNKPDQRVWLAKASGQRTVPQVFINDEPVGGYTDIAALDRAGKLDVLLNA